MFETVTSVPPSPQKKNSKKTNKQTNAKTEMITKREIYEFKDKMKNFIKVMKKGLTKKNNGHTTPLSSSCTCSSQK